MNNITKINHNSPVTTVVKRVVHAPAGEVWICSWLS